MHNITRQGEPKLNIEQINSQPIMILTGTTTRGEAAERTVCCVVESSKHLLTQAELGLLSSQFKEILQLTPPSKPLRVVLPQWVQTEEFLYVVGYYRKEPLAVTNEPTIGLKVFKLAKFFSNRELQQYSISALILPKLSMKTMAKTLTEAWKLFSESKSDDLATKLYKSCLTYVGKSLLSMENKEGVLSQIKTLAGKDDGEIIDDVFEAVYVAAITNYEEDKIPELIKLHLAAFNESNLVTLFTKKLKGTLEKALKSINEKIDNAVQWNAKTDQKSQTIERGGENFHLFLHKEEKSGRYQLFLATGNGEEPQFKRKPAVSHSIERQYRSTLISQRSPFLSPKAKKIFPTHLGLSSGYLKRSVSRQAARHKPQQRSISYNNTMKDISKELSNIKLSAEANSAINLNATFSMRDSSVGKVLCLVSYIEMGTKDPEAKMNIHYVNTMDKKIIIKERSIKDFGKNERNVPIRAHMFHSFTVSTLLENLLRNFEDIATQSSVSNLSHHQLLFIVNNARKKGASENAVAEAVLRWCNSNAGKCPVDRLSCLVKKILWKKVTSEKLREFRNWGLNIKINGLIPGPLVIQTQIPSPFSEPAESRVNTTMNKSFSITNTANTPIRTFSFTTTYYRSQRLKLPNRKQYQVCL
eukprot:TRINITY_DN140_c0_g1_i1.p1 TRINITY_DN140_c0_g1~~TRINITY_DN140_c0_g1_i1.p1  ORF type:complete len:642 (+),score=57.74 TRINITY_DN140_c0_g1_i1:971-2896(+)